MNMKATIEVQIVSVVSEGNNDKLIERWHMRLGTVDFLVSAFHESASRYRISGEMGTDVWLAQLDGTRIGNAIPDCSYGDWNIIKAVEWFIEYQTNREATFKSQNGLEKMTFEVEVEIK